MSRRCRLLPSLTHYLYELVTGPPGLRPEAHFRQTISLAAFAGISANPNLNALLRLRFKKGRVPSVAKRDLIRWFAICRSQRGLAKISRREHRCLSHPIR